MELFYQFTGVMDERSNRSLVFRRLAEVFDAEASSYLWATEKPRLEPTDPGEGIDAWGSMINSEFPVDVAQLLRVLLQASTAFPAAMVELRADECPGFILDGKIEIIQQGKFQRYKKAFNAYLDDYKSETVSWDFQIDPRIWSALLEKNKALSESQVLTTRLSRAVTMARNPKLRGPFLGFPVEYPGMQREARSLDVPASLVSKLEELSRELGRSPQELTERGIFSGLLA